MSSNDLTGFREVYERHVDLVRSGDMAGVLADMAPGSVPGVFEGVDVPRGEVRDASIRDVRLEGTSGVGECVYVTAEGDVALRSTWAHDGTTWKAEALENFA